MNQKILAANLLIAALLTSYSLSPTQITWRTRLQALQWRAWRSHPEPTDTCPIQGIKRH